MLFEKENRETKSGFLLIFGSHTRLTRRLPEQKEGKWQLYLCSGDTGFLEDLRITILIRKDGLWLGNRQLGSKTPLYFEVSQKERLMLLLSEEKKVLEPAMRIHIQRGEELKIGSAYTAQIFYECCSMIGTDHGKLVLNGQGNLQLFTDQKGVYVDGRTVCGSKVLSEGSCVDIYGLHILILKELLVCVSFCGISRVAWTGSAMFSTTSRVSRKEQGKIEQKPVQAEPLHRGEVELLLPETPKPYRRQPLFLSIGPMMTMVLPMLLMAQLSSRYMGENAGGFYRLSIVMSGSTAFLAVFWGLLNRAYECSRARRERKEQERSYRAYLSGMETELTRCLEENRRILSQRYPAVCTFLSDSRGRPAVLWNRFSLQEDFLFFRLGLGCTDFQMKLKCSGSEKEIIKGKLAGEAEKLVQRFAVIDQVPVGLDLFRDRQIGILQAGKDVPPNLLLQIILQAAACVCYTELKVACFYRKERGADETFINCLKWLPHCFSEDRRVRFLAGDDREAGEILPALTGGLVKGAEKKRMESSTGSHPITVPWFLVVVLDQELLSGEALYRYLTDRQAGYPVSTIFVEQEREKLPRSCECLLSDQGEMCGLQWERAYHRQFEPDICSVLEAEGYARAITGLYAGGADRAGVIPDQVSFLQMYGCDEVQDLECAGRWQSARSGERLKVPIGQGEGGSTVYLDVHEKFHGPHGLVAGTTGSGKSELLQTYLLSIAISYSPCDVNFFMIDYKGGGTGNMLKELPHCAGVISNLSGKQIKRAMSAISSENKRRQALLGEFQVNHIDAYSRLYREGKAKKPMPHLLLVVDEFAELKKEEPEFMQEIISLAQVGRSLGVHLILATQKPAGTVDDKIWSNARFRLCLKVQDRQDSMDMLKNGDAAALTRPGRCYLQIGNQEYYELFQAGYCGGAYRPGNEGKEKAVMCTGTGKRIRRSRQKQQEEHSLIRVIVDYIGEIARETGHPSAAGLWLPELPEILPLPEEAEGLCGELGQTESEQTASNRISLFLGQCDDPVTQRQFPFFYSPLEQGHLLVCGSPGTGKTTFLQTILWQLCTRYEPDQVQSIVVSMGQDGFGCFADMTGCIGILKEKRDLELFFFHLKEQIEARREKLSGISCRQYNRSGKKPIPYLFLLMDGYAGFGDLLSQEQEAYFLRLVSEGIRLGIYLILSVTAPNELGNRIFEKIKMTVALEMSDRFQYGDILRQYDIPVLPEEGKRGRGLCRMEGRILEFQTALVFGEPDDYERIGRIAGTGRQQRQVAQRSGAELPDPIPILPDKPEIKRLLLEYDGSGLPIGYSFLTGRIEAVHTQDIPCFLISGSRGTGKHTLLRCLLEGALRCKKEVVLIDPDRRMEVQRSREGLLYLAGAEQVTAWQEMEKGGSEKEIVILIESLSALCVYLERPGEERLRRKEFWEKILRGAGSGYFLAGLYDASESASVYGNEFFRSFVSWQQGICLGGNLAFQRELSFDDVNYTKQNRREPPGIGYLKNGVGSETRQIWLPVIGREETQ